MQESKEIGPHITTREELDALYRKKQDSVKEDKSPEDKETDDLPQNA